MGIGATQRTSQSMCSEDAARAAGAWSNASCVRISWTGFQGEVVASRAVVGEAEERAGGAPPHWGWASGDWTGADAKSNDERVVAYARRRGRACVIALLDEQRA